MGDKKQVDNLGMKMKKERVNYSKYTMIYVLEVLKEHTSSAYEVDEVEGEKEKEIRWLNTLSLREIQKEIKNMLGGEKPPKTETIQKAIESINSAYKSMNTLYDREEAKYCIMRVLNGKGEAENIADFEEERKKIRGNGHVEYRYFLAEREFDKEEVILLYNIVRYSNMISRSYAKNLGKKVLEQVSDPERKLIEKKPFLTDGSEMTMNGEVFMNLQTLTKCIGEDKGISFEYYEYGMDKKLHKRKESAYKAFPHGISWSGGKGYLLASNYSKELKLQVWVYRIDKMKAVQECAIVPTQEQRNLKLEDRVKNSAFMFVRQQEEEINVILRCEQRILANVIEKFADCELKEDSEKGYFQARIKGTTQQGMLYWVLEFSSACEVKEPESLREEVRKTLKKALDRHK